MLPGSPSTRNAARNHDGLSNLHAPPRITRLGERPHSGVRGRSFPYSVVELSEQALLSEVVGVQPPERQRRKEGDQEKPRVGRRSGQGEDGGDEGDRPAL